MINLDAERAKATIAWLSADAPAPDARISAAALEAGYRFISGGAAAMLIDLVAIDLRGVESSSPLTQSLVASARRLAPAAGIIIVASADAPRDSRAALRRIGDLCFVRDDGAAVIGAIRERLRLASLVEEVGDRLKTLVAEGQSVDVSRFVAPSPAAVSVLVAGKPSPLTLSACNAVKSAGIETHCVFTAGQVMRALDHCRFDGVIIIPADENDLLLALARALRRHHEHRRLPVTLVSGNETLLARCAMRDGFGYVMKDHLDGDLAYRFELSARRARLACSMRGFLKAPDNADHGAGEPAGARFFAAHAYRSCRRADATEKPLSFVVVSLAEPLDAGAMAEVARTAARLVRAEDMIARLAAGKLIVMLRDARERDAARVAARLEGVISGTLHRSKPEIARVMTAAIERASGDDLETVIARLLKRQQDQSRIASATP